METVYLLGSEAVQNAGYAMRQAAEEMKHAASNIESSLFSHRQFLEQWLQDYRNLLEDNK